MKKVNVNEFDCALKAAQGNRKPSEAGIRMCNQKYMLIQHNPDSSSAYLGREGGGGACVAKTDKALVIAIYDKKAEMSNKRLQNPGDCNDLVERMVEFLKSAGY